MSKSNENPKDPRYMYNIHVREGKRNWRGRKRYYIVVESFNGQVLLHGELRYNLGDVKYTAELLHRNINRSRLYFLGVRTEWQTYSSEQIVIIDELAYYIFPWGGMIEENVNVVAHPKQLKKVADLLNRVAQNKKRAARGKAKGK